MSAHKSPRGRKRAGRRARAALDRQAAKIAAMPMGTVDAEFVNRLLRGGGHQAEVLAGEEDA